MADDFFKKLRHVLIFCWQEQLFDIQLTCKMKGEVIDMAKSIRKGIKTGLIILAIYIVFVLYLLFVSDRVEKLDTRSQDEQIQNTLKIGK